jgi:hypothetical protein
MTDAVKAAGQYVFRLSSNNAFAALWSEIVNQSSVSLEPIDFVWQDYVVSIAPCCLAL